MIKKFFIRFFRIFKVIFLLFISLTALYFLFALILSLAKTHPPEQDCKDKNEVFISSNGVHLDIVIPVDLLEPDLRQNLEILPGTKYVSFGWGDRRFYLNTPEWKDLTFSTAFNALFLKSKTAMHVTCLRNTYSDWKSLNLCRVQLNELITYIDNSFQKDETGKLIKIPVKGYYNFDFFYEANGSFSIFKTCNIWVNSALREIEVETSVWSPFDFGILYHLPD